MKKIALSVFLLFAFLIGFAIAAPLPTLTRGVTDLAKSLAGLKINVIAGGSAGNHTVTGIATEDTLLSVLRVDLDANAPLIGLDDQTSVFSITAANTIADPNGVDTTGDKLIIYWYDHSAYTGR